MNLESIIVLSLSLIIWAVVPLRQIGQKYFNFFVLLISGDIITIIARLVFHSNTNIFYIISGILGFLSIYESRKSVLIKVFVILFFAAAFYVEFQKLGYKYEFALISICDLLLFIKFTHQFVIKYFDKKVFDVFNCSLSVYQLLSFLKFIGYIVEIKYPDVLLDTATTVQMLFGVLFILFKEDSPRLNLKLKYD